MWMWTERKGRRTRAARCTLWTLVDYKPIMTHQRAVKLRLCPAVPGLASNESELLWVRDTPLMRGFHVYYYMVMLGTTFISLRILEVALQGSFY